MTAIRPSTLLPDAVRARCAELKLRPARLAHRMNVKPPTVTRIMSGHTTWPHARVTDALDRALGWDPGYAASLVPPKPAPEPRRTEKPYKKPPRRVATDEHGRPFPRAVIAPWPVRPPNYSPTRQVEFWGYAVDVASAIVADAEKPAVTS